MTFLTLLRDGEPAPAPGQQVLRRDDYARLVEAAGIVALAREEAARRAERAAAEAEDMRRLGFEQGRAEGKAEVAEQMMETLTASVEHLASMESSLVDVVMRSIRTILGKFEDGELAAHVVTQALRIVMDEKRVRLRVALSDAPAVEERLDDIRRRYPGIVRLDLVPDVSLSPGGCVLETDVGVVDASLDRQLAIIEETFRRHLEERQG